MAGLVAGAMSMAAGEYVPVSSQADTEEADMARERHELAEIYVQRGVAPDLAREDVRQMMEKDAFKTHARDELGLARHMMARPVQVVFTSAVTFLMGAALPLVVALLAPAGTVAWAVSIAGMIGLAILGGVSIWKPTARVVFWGVVAMASIAIIGALIGRGV